MDQRPEDLVVRPRESIRTFIRFFAFIKPHWHRVLLVVILNVVTSPLPLLSGLLGRVMIDRIYLNTAAPGDERIISFLLLLATIEALNFLNLSLVGLVFFDPHSLTHFLGTYMAGKVRLSLRKKLYYHLQRLPLTFFQRRPVGEHMYRVLNDTGGVAFGPDPVSLATNTIPDLIGIISQLGIAVAALSSLEPFVAIATFCYVVPKVILQQYTTTRVQRRTFLFREREQWVPAVLRESIAGASTIKSFGQTRREARKYGKTLVAMLRRRVALDWWDQCRNLSQAVIELFFGVALYAYVGYETVQGKFSVGSLFLIMGIVRNVPAPLIKTVEVIQGIRIHLVPAERILQTLDVPLENADIANPVRLRNLKGQIDLKDVRFSYPDGTQVLHGVDLSIRPGESLAIVGPSGQGKSTLLNLLLRLYRPTNGSIHYDGVNLNDLCIGDLTRTTGAVLQDTHLFLGSIRSNLKFGWPLASDEEVAEATQIAEIHDFIESLPEGYHTDVREGSRMSGGQRQRLGIARALVGRPKLLLFDEPTSSLDTRTETEVWTAMQSAMKGRTSVIVTHRLPTARHADRIAVLYGGRIKEIGTHDELMGRDGMYATMWNQQFHTSEEGAGA